MVKISYEDKIKNQNLNKFNDLQPDLDIKAVLHDLKLWKTDLYQLEAKQRLQLESVKNTYIKIKELKHKIDLWEGKVVSFQIPTLD